MIPLSVEEFVATGRYPHLSPFTSLTKDDYAAIDDALDQAGLSSLRHRTMTTLSGGERQMAFIAAALAQETSILLLDEPSTFLDYRHQANVSNLLTNACREAGKTVIAVHHDINTAIACSDRIYAIKDGAVAFEGTPAETADAAVLKNITKPASKPSPPPIPPSPLLLPEVRNEKAGINPCRSAVALALALLCCPFFRHEAYPHHRRRYGTGNPVKTSDSARTVRFCRRSNALAQRHVISGAVPQSAGHTVHHWAFPAARRWGPRCLSGWASPFPCSEFPAPHWPRSAAHCLPLHWFMASHALRGGFSTHHPAAVGHRDQFFFSSLILLIQFSSSTAQSFRIVQWMMGSLATADYGHLFNLLPFLLIGTAILSFLHREMNLMMVGEDLAVSRGVNTGLVKKLIFLAASLMVGGVVAFCGPIGFVGMMAPHICRLLVGADHRWLTPATFLFRRTVPGGLRHACAQYAVRRRNSRRHHHRPARWPFLCLSPPEPQRRFGNLELNTKTLSSAKPQT